ncbi:hypothetical protein [Thalassobellus suaedae]|uniref:Uncharacterized protein n=1 Tax=Thalassobellus suaedae TaxID=3074124 RepID=A0ABY9XPQ2_9FLAO|nr:hypothetical protein RHP51_11275 [Flavobacteriaceae bacterium HL-DH14]
MDTTANKNLKAQFLLGAGLDVLHFETKEWLETIAFWKDEVRFFDNLLKKKVSAETSKQEYAEMLKNLDKIHKDLFNDFEDDIMSHERMLSKLEQGEKGLSDGQYRDKHHHLLGRMNTFKSNFNQFKKIVFDYVKTI